MRSRTIEQSTYVPGPLRHVSAAVGERERLSLALLLFLPVPSQVWNKGLHQAWTLVAAMSLDGYLFAELHRGSTNGARFLELMKRAVHRFPEECVFVTDNWSGHHTVEVELRELLWREKRCVGVRKGGDLRPDWCACADGLLSSIAAVCLVAEGGWCFCRRTVAISILLSRLLGGSKIEFVVHPSRFALARPEIITLTAVLERPSRLRCRCSSSRPSARSPMSK